MQGAGLRSGLEIPSSEKRQGRRFALRLRCRVLFPSMNSQVFWGFTRNISRSGVLVVLEKVAAAELCVTIGEFAEVSIDLPHSPNFSARCLVCSTRVVRVVDEESSEPSVACQIARFRVEDQDQRASDGDASFLGFLGSSYIQ